MIHKHIIVGAGPAGLAIAGRLKNTGEDFIILEASKNVGNSWRNHYDRLHLHTVKKYSHLPHLPFKEALPQYVSKNDFVNYMEDYISHFGIEPKYGHPVEAIEKSDIGWKVTTSKDEFQAENVIVATGYNRVPIVPNWKGVETFQKSLTHSKEYKNHEPFVGKKVLIIGMGNTGAEIALDLAEHDIEVSISLRSAINIVPREFYGRATQETAMKLRKLPNWLADKIGLILREITIGNLKKYGIERPAEAPNAQVRNYGKIPVIDLGTVKMIKEGKIKMLPNVSQFNTHSILFTDGQEKEFDEVILATGYSAQITDYLNLPKEYLDSKGTPQKAWFEEDNLKGLYFIGFNTAYTGILNSIFIESEKIVNHILEINKETSLSHG